MASLFGAAPPRPGDVSRNKIVLVGCSGQVGKHTIRALTKSGAGCDRLLICSRNPKSTCCSEFCSSGCRVVNGSMGDVDSLKPHFASASAVFLITPGAENRAELVQNGLNAAKAAGVPFVLVVSVSTASNTRTVYGQQFSAIEAATKACGIPFCLLRLPMFTDNQKIMFDSVRRDGKIWGPVNPDARMTTVCTYDVGEAAAAILLNPTAHHNKTYHLTGPSYTKNELAGWFSSVLGRAITYEQKSYDDAAKMLRDMGWPDWQVKGLVELGHMVDDGRYEFRDTDFKRITGRDPTPPQTWIEWHRDEIVGSAASGRGASSGAADKTRVTSGMDTMQGGRSAIPQGTNWPAGGASGSWSASGGGSAGTTGGRPSFGSSGR